MPRSVPWREREWLSCTKSVGMPCSARDVGAERLHEEAALVAVNGGRQQDESVESSLKPLHMRGGG